MGILGRYILKEILKTFVPLWLGLSFLPMLGEWLSWAFKLKGSVWTTLILFAYKIPSYLQLVFPIALVVATVVVFRSMNRNREIVAFESFGIRYRDLIAPLLITLIITGLPFLLLSLEIAPKGMKEHYLLYSELKGDGNYIGQVRNEKIWYKSGDILYNVGFYDSKKQELFDLSLYEFDQNFQLTKITTAKKAVWNGRSWTLLQSTHIFVGPELEQVGREDFDVLENNILEKPADLVLIDFIPEILTENELYKTINRYEQMGINTNIWETAFHSRLSYLFLSFILMLIALPKTLMFRRTNNLSKQIAISTLFCLLLWITYSLCLNLGIEGYLPPALAAWGPVVLLFPYALYEILTLKLKRQSE